MCEIHFIYKKKKLERNDLNEFIKMMCFGSLRKHDDAWGFFTDKTSFKKGGPFDPTATKISSLKSNFIVGHNRLSTMGIGPLWSIGKKKNGKSIEDLQHHPFELEDFLLVHNGVINNAKSIFKKYKIQTPIKTDSYAIIYLICHFFKMSSKENRQEKIMEAIQRTTKKLKGWYSIILYDKKENKLYYFKDSITSFNFCTIDKSFLIGSTSGLNMDYTYIEGKKEDFIPKPDVIYLIKDFGKGKFFKEIKKLKRKKEINNLKEEFILEKPGEIYELVSNLPGNPKDYEISENLKIKIPYKSMTKIQNNLLKDHLNSKKIKVLIKDQSFIFNLEDIQ